MENIINKMNEFNKSFSIEIYSNNIMDFFEEDKILTLSNEERYELALNQSYNSLVMYNEIKKSIFDWIDIEDFHITNKQLCKYITNRLNEELSIDRKYFFYELQFYFSENKKSLILGVIESLKNCILRKREEENSKEIFFRLFSRYIVLIKMFKIENDEFIKNRCEGIINKLNFEDDFFTAINFFNFIFKEIERKDSFFSILENTFENFTIKVDEKILVKIYEPTRNYSLRIMEIYKLKSLNNYEKRLYFYKKEIDNALVFCREININTCMRNEWILKKTALLSKDLKKENYKLKEIKLLSKDLSNFISDNYSKLFPSHKLNEDEIESIENDFARIGELYNKIIVDEDKIDFIVYNCFHLNYYKNAYLEYEKNEKKETQFFQAFFGSSKVTDHKGYSYSVENEDVFMFFNHRTKFYNGLFLYLDNEFNWVKNSIDILIKDITSIKLIKDDYIKQFQIAIKSFSEEKYIEFMYITPSLIELLLKSFLEKINGELLSLSGKNLLEKTITQVIEELKVDENSYLDAYILDYISHILVSKVGLNLRNNILHANYSDGYFNKTNAMYIYILFTYLIRYFANDELED